MHSECDTSRSPIPVTITSEASTGSDSGASDMLRNSSIPSPIPVRSGVSPTPSWKAVGSPTTPSGFLSGSFNENSDAGFLSRSPALNIGSYSGTDIDNGVRGLSIPIGDESTSVPSGGNWGGLGLSWNSSNIWGDQSVNRTPSPNKSSIYATDGFSGISQSMARQPLPIIEESAPQYRQQRSFSVTYGQLNADFLDDDFDDKERYRQALGTLGEELTDEEYANALRPRVRSQSSFGAYHFPPQSNFASEPILAPPGFANEREDRVSNLHPLWGDQIANKEAASMFRRRSIANPVGFGNMWDKNAGANPASSGISAYAQALNAERLNRLHQQRRYSLAPSPSFQESQYSDPLQDMRMNNRSNIEPEYNMNYRRHSVAAPGLSNVNNNQTDRFLSESLDSIHIDDTVRVGSFGNAVNEMEDFFENDDHRQRPFSELGKGVPLNTLPSQGPLYVVEFKGGRTDVFYTAENSGLICHVGDLVIVEADRGKDLGKVINDSITPQHLQILQQNQAAEGGSGDVRFGNKEIQPKLIYRLAQSSEVSIFMSKNQDEAKAMMICQTKVRQKKLPMEVVDAEYQWDRRKLTFYFVAERRIDFRELVRDLFKIYKTRIWMCAVNPNPITSLLCAINPASSQGSVEKCPN